MNKYQLHNQFKEDFVDKYDDNVYRKALSSLGILLYAEKDINYKSVNLRNLARYYKAIKMKLEEQIITLQEEMKNDNLLNKLCFKYEIFKLKNSLKKLEKFHNNFEKLTGLSLRKTQEIVKEEVKKYAHTINHM